MKKKLLAYAFVALCFSVVSLQAAETAESKVGEEKGWSPIRLTLWPRAAALPWDTNVYGLNIGLATDMELGTELDGVELSLFGSLSNNVDGLIMSLASTTKNSTGVQIALGGVMQNSSGWQLCPWVALSGDCGTVVQAVNVVNEVHGADYSVQIGIYNRSIDSKGFQIGLMNYMDDGFLPLFPFFNFSLSETHKDSQNPGKL